MKGKEKTLKGVKEVEKYNLKNQVLSHKRSEKGITLVALVVTIIVLLILAGVTIITLFGENGLINMADKARRETENSQANDIAGLGSLSNQMNSVLNGGGTGGTEGGETPTEPEIPEGLEVGSEVTYNTSGTYEWKHKYCSSSKAEKVDGTDAFDLLESGTGKNFNISKWKVLSIDETTGKVELVPSAPTTGEVYLGEAQGYNNGVKLLNDACSSLYGNTTKGIKARSIKIEDIEKYMVPEKLVEATAGANISGSPDGGYQSSEYSASCSRYPVIYGKEKLAVINGTTPEGANLDLSEQNALIERTEGTSTTSAIGAITTATSIQPYQTGWAGDISYMSTAFKDYTKKDSTKDNYYKLIMPKGTRTTYWVASRCVGTSLAGCYFNMRRVISGAVNSSNMYDSCGNANTSDYSRALFPVVTLNSDLIEGNATSGFSVK